MATLHTNSSTVEAVPEFLTVEEAARVMRIGRTKAYALTRQWRATGGKTGMPVVDIGVLRVPRRQLEKLLGVEILVVPGPEDDAPAVEAAVEPAGKVEVRPPAGSAPVSTRRSRRASRRPRSDSGQQSLPLG